mmetsp:Transcript_14377/g.21630  ORF Transcript_14377/g.21630 Transcript_14377/m.21630 type:complete len:150 (-) Transcript_14377:140-589(-)|eukprot:CAMPEP_0184382624 /NCGR_PEP_ID=MMETSP0007-20130409/6492_1 /TAXON_ID=97485 /ORGANISM="Prymnesium parvum, Strain Texoma1" /LENGTH=149 /DNA_ID=CAMNT_0026728745 /DNA_START=18 /DNA_END=467 /DNA_ORIENTATION=+
MATVTEAIPPVTQAPVSKRSERSPAQLEALARARQKAVEVRKQLAMERKSPPVTEASEALPEPPPTAPPAPEPEEEKEEIEYVKPAPRSKKKPPKKRIIVVQESESSSEEEVEVRMPRKKKQQEPRAHMPQEPEVDERLLKSYGQLFSI